MKHPSCSVLLAVLLTACAHARTAPPETPDESARHRAALALVTVANATTTPLAILFRSATPPLQEVMIGSLAAGERKRLAPVPAGEPIILLARTPDGTELALPARSFAIDAEWTWEIPLDATFRKP